MTVVTRLALVSVLLLSVLACDEAVAPDTTDVRLLNDTGRVLTGVRLDPGRKTLTFERLEAGETTPFVGVEAAFPNPFVEAVVDGETHRLQPIDHLPEEQLDLGGRYTYVLGFNEDAGALTLAEVRQED